MALPVRETPSSALQKISELAEFAIIGPDDLDDQIALLLEIRRLAEDGLNLKWVSILALEGDEHGSA